MVWERVHGPQPTSVTLGGSTVRIRSERLLAGARAGVRLFECESGAVLVVKLLLVGVRGIPVILQRLIPGENQASVSDDRVDGRIRVPLSVPLLPASFSSQGCTEASCGLLKVSSEHCLSRSLILFSLRFYSKRVPVRQLMLVRIPNLV